MLHRNIEDWFHLYFIFAELVELHFLPPGFTLPSSGFHHLEASILSHFLSTEYFIEY